jgi:hypothetical protein
VAGGWGNNFGTWGWRAVNNKTVKMVTKVKTPTTGKKKNNSRGEKIR